MLAVGRIENEVTGTLRRSSWRTGKEIDAATRNGWACHVDALPTAFWQMLRLLRGDSSISARMACKSSVAETTGNRITSMHPREKRHCRDLRPTRPLLRSRHSQQAGRASSNQARLSSSSICEEFKKAKIHPEDLVFQKNQT